VERRERKLTRAVRVESRDERRQRLRVAAAQSRGLGEKVSDTEVDFGLFVRREFPTRVFAKGNTIFREGEHADEFFVVVRGEFEIRSGNRWFETAGQNDIFGEMGHHR
jgi:hypothetical protein